MALDSVMPHLHLGADQPEGHSSSWKRTTLLVLAVTLHNIPEGMAVGFSFALAAQHGDDPALYTGALALALGMGLQNFPEGAAISLPLRQEGLPAWKSFVYGGLSGIVEPLFGILAVLAAGSIQPLLPWLLAFAAGAMLYVVVEELIPEAHLGEHSNIGTLGVMAGFCVMVLWTWPWADPARPMASKRKNKGHPGRVPLVLAWRLIFCGFHSAWAG